MKKYILVAGSIAYDHLMSFDGLFKNAIAPEDLHKLSVSLGVKERQVFFGGCAGNIAYHLKKLGGNPLPFGFVGPDFGEYEAWMKQNSIDTSFLIRSDKLLTASAFVLNDKKKNQLVFFDAGASTKFEGSERKALARHFLKLKDKVSIAIISANNVDFMIHFANLCKWHKVPYIFDPGQVTTLFGKNDFIKMLNGAFGFMANEHEMSLAKKLTGMALQDIARHVQFAVETKGAQGSVIYTHDKEIRIPAYKPKCVKDPTGCGDAYRAGLLYKLVKASLSLDALPKAGRLGASLAQKVLAKIGVQVP